MNKFHQALQQARRDRQESRQAPPTSAAICRHPCQSDVDRAPRGPRFRKEWTSTS